MEDPEALKSVALKRIEQWYEEHPEAFLTFSGGKDSTVLLHLILQVNKDPKIAFFDTGFLYRQTYDFVKNIQKWWDVEVAYITTSPSPLEALKASGHWDLTAPNRSLDMKQVLVENYLEKAKEHFDSKYSLYGLRADESKARNVLMRTTRGTVVRHTKGEFRDASRAPIWDWRGDDVNRYIINHKVPLNTAYRRLRDLRVPSKARRTGVPLGAGIHLGDWATNYQVDPGLGKMLETHFPLLKDFR